LVAVAACFAAGVPCLPLLEGQKQPYMAIWQNIAVCVLVVAAAFYVIRYVWRTGRRRFAGGCSACGQCPTAPSAALVTIEPLKPERPAAKGP
jgi:hypothetical protein